MCILDQLFGLSAAAEVSIMEQGAREHIFECVIEPKLDERRLIYCRYSQSINYLYVRTEVLRVEYPHCSNVYSGDVLV